MSAYRWLNLLLKERSEGVACYRKYAGIVCQRVHSQVLERVRVVTEVYLCGGVV